MTFSEHVFRYCERGASDALLAEPINVISNLAFLFAALIGLQLLLWRPREERSADHYLLVFLVLAIGLGSLAFHLFATEGTALLDVIPIGLFMLVYLGFALNRFLGVPVGLDGAAGDRLHGDHGHDRAGAMLGRRGRRCPVPRSKGRNRASTAASSICRR